MAYRIAIGSEDGTFRDVCSHEDLGDAMEAFNDLINQRTWCQSDLVVSITDDRSGKRLAQYGLQDFNYRSL